MATWKEQDGLQSRQWECQQMFNCIYLFCALAAFFLLVDSRAFWGVGAVHPVCVCHMVLTVWRMSVKTCVKVIIPCLFLTLSISLSDSKIIVDSDVLYMFIYVSFFNVRLTPAIKGCSEHFNANNNWIKRSLILNEIHLEVCILSSKQPSI